MTTSWHAYPSSYNLGHRAVADLLNYPLYVEEKVDGSQFSFGVFPIVEGGGGSIGGQGLEFLDGHELCVRSKGAIMHVDAPEKMFTKAVETARSIQHLLTPGWTYRCEYLAKPKHNTLAYDRTPNNYLIGFDISTGDNQWLTYEEKRDEFSRIGLETVPLLGVSWPNNPLTLDALRTILDTTQSVLGGQLIEGVVLKPFGHDMPYGPDKKTLIGKFVSERFKEAHREAWKETSPNQKQFIDKVIEAYRRPARYQKSIQHMRERGLLTDSPKDIGLLMKEFEADLEREEADEIKEALFKHFFPQIVRGAKAQLPQYYKEELLRLQFEREGANA